ncbi:MAG: peptidase [Erysipelotrichales bacterium]|nr:peptidase [Erysipelotrichales bacterium]
MNFKIGDIVTRNSHQNDHEFVIVHIDYVKKIAILKGKALRLNADANLDDLKLSEMRKIDMNPELNLPNYSVNTIFGKVLHIDGDSSFLEKCMRLYKKYNVPAIGYFVEERNMPLAINDLLLKHKPDILVITGHDAMSQSPMSYRFMNSENFLNTVKNARIFQPSKDALPIVVGGCQSDFKSLIEYSNFASSPAGINIAALDPAIVAIMISTTPVNEFVNVLAAVNQTSGKNAGITGVDTRGVARKIY